MPDDDLYELNEDDAVECNAPVDESAGPDAPGDYELDEVTDNPDRGDLEILAHPAKYCQACGFDLTLIDAEDSGVCPGCEKKYDPNDESTYRTTPLPTQDNFWLQSPRLAGYALIVWFLLGRPIIHFVGDGLSGKFADAVLAFGVLAMLPWVLVGVLLGLEIIEEHHNPKLAVTLPLGFAFGLLLTFGLHPGVMLIGGIAGAFAGFLRTWRTA